MLVAKYARTDTHPAPAKVGVQVRELSPTTVQLVVSGEIDASTETSLLDGIVAKLGRYRQLVLDLSHVQFFGTAGYSALHRLHSHCARSAVDWVLIGGPEVRRLMRLCDPDGIFPSADNIVSAVAALARGPHRTPLLKTRLLRSVPTN